MVSPPMHKPALAIALVLGSAQLFVSPAAHAQGSAGVTLHVDTIYVLEVDHRADPKAAWKHVCTSPCDVAVPPDGEYRVRGHGVTASAPFALHSQGDHALIQVTPGIKNKERTGWSIIAGGAAAVVVGAVIDAVGTGEGMVAGQGGVGDAGNTSSAKVNFYLAGTTLIVAGLVAAVFGGSFVFDNAHSAVHEGPAGTPNPGRFEEGEHATRDPVTRSAEVALDRAPSIVVPLFTTTF